MQHVKRLAAPRMAILVAVLALLVVIGTVGTPLIGQGAFHGSDAVYGYSPRRDLRGGGLPGPPTRERHRRRHGPRAASSAIGHATWTSPSGTRTRAEAPPWVDGLRWRVQPDEPHVRRPSGQLRPGAGKVVEMLVAAGFTFLFLRRLRLGRPAAVLGGMIYMATGFQVAWSNWPSRRSAPIPALFWAVERHLQDRTRRTFVAPAIALGLMLASNFPAIVGFTLALLGPYVLLHLGPGRRGLARHGSSPGRPGDRAGLGATLAAVVVVLLREFLSAYDVLEDRDQGPDSHLGLHWLSTLVAPFALGNPSDGVAYGQGTSSRA